MQPFPRQRRRFLAALLVGYLALGALGCASARLVWKRAITPTKPEPAPSMTLRLIADIPLPGPLPGGALSIVDDRVHVPVAGGVAVTDWTQGNDAEVETRSASGQPSPPSDEVAWAVDPTGRYRSRVVAPGRLLTEERCKALCKGWHREWKLDLPGDSAGAPLVTSNRIYVGARDNRIYGLLSKNGHRVWATDIGERVAGSMVLWAAPDDTDLRVLVIQPELGTGLVLLEARGGKQVADFSIQEEQGTLKGIPVVTPDGRILVTREKYNVIDASLMVFELTQQAGETTPKPGAGEGPKPGRGSPGSDDPSGTPGQSRTRERKG